MGRQEQWERAIASGYGSAYLDLVRLGVILLDSGQDVLMLKETVDRLSEAQAKEMLTVAAASGAQWSHRSVGVAALDEWTNRGALRMESGTPSRDTAWAVSQENVEVVFAAFRRFEADDMAGFGALLDPGIAATAAAGWPEPGPWIGADALVTQLERIRAGWSEHRMAQVEMLAERGEWVVIQYSWETEVATNGIAPVFDLVGAFRVRNGLIAEAHFRWNRAEALKAARLRKHANRRFRRERSSERGARTVGE